VTAAFVVLAAAPLRSQTPTPAGTAFTYQGRLNDSGMPATAMYDLQFKLFDVVTVGTGTQIGGTLSVPAVQVTGGLFTVSLDFGSNAFDGSRRFLEIALKPVAGMSYTTLAPRQELTPTPYSQTIFTRTIVVKPLGGTAVANGTLLRNALAGITTSSSTNPWLVKIEPGIYDVGATPLQMISYVDVEGSGEGVTKITGAANLFLAGTVVGTSNSELRWLTIESTGGPSYSIAFYSSVSTHLSQVTLSASGATTSTRGAFLTGGAPTLRDITINVSSSGTEAVGVYIAGASTQATIADSNATLTGGSQAYGFYSASTTLIERSSATVTPGASGSAYGLYVGGGSMTVLHSSLRALSGTTAYGVYIVGGTVGVVSSFLGGTTAASSSLSLCPGSVNANTFQLLNASCQ